MAHAVPGLRGGKAGIITDFSSTGDGLTKQFGGTNGRTLFCLTIGTEFEDVEDFPVKAQVEAEEVE